MKIPEGISNKSCIIRLTFIISLTLTCLFITAHFSPSDAANAKKKLSRIKKELHQKKLRIKETIQKERSILSRIENIDKSINGKNLELKTVDSKISLNRSKIRDLKKEIDVVSAKLDDRRTHLEERLRTLYKNQYGGNALILFTAKDYQDLIRRSRYISLLTHYDRRAIDTYRSELQIITFKKKNKEILQGRLRSDKDSARKKKKELENSRIKKDRLLATIRSKRSTYEKTVKELEASSQKIQEVIKKIKARKIPRAVTGKGFKSLKGKLPWPITGKILVPYGKYKDPKFNISVFKNGIEIKAKKGESPRAVAGGRVVYADWFKGYGLLLIINHGNGYHSLYGNLSEIFHKTGDIIRKGSTLGKIGESSLLSVPSLYFEIRYRGKPSNPLRWLERKGRKRNS